MMRIRLLLAALLLSFAGQAMAVELPMNKPSPDQAALEQKLANERALPPGKIEGFVHIPDQKERVLIQPEGREFRDVRNHWQPWIDAVLIVGAVLAMAALYFLAGTMHYTADPRGRTIKRFTVFERFVHWLTAVSFLWLSFTGLNLVFGRPLLEPVLGDDTFASLSALLKVSHNFVGFAFILGLAAMSVQWLTVNLPSKLDIQWLKAAGGMFGGPHPPARKFNAGQKMIYWIAVFGGGAICITGVVLLWPFSVTNVTGMQLMHGAHSIIAALMMATIIGHIYLGSVGVRGSFQAMSTGRVDLNWAKEHHGLWVEDQVRKGAVPPDALDGPITHAAE